MTREKYIEFLDSVEENASVEDGLEKARSVSTEMSESHERLEFVLAINELNLNQLRKLAGLSNQMKSVLEIYGKVVPGWLRWSFLGTDRIIEWSDDIFKKIIAAVRAGRIERTVYATIGIIESDPVFLVDELFLRSELDRVLANVMAVSTSHVREALLHAVGSLFRNADSPHPKQTARLLHSFSTAVADAIENPNVSAAYYRGFSYTHKDSSGHEIGGSKLPGKAKSSREDSFTWTPVPMLEALSLENQLELTRFYRAFLRRVMWHVIQWNSDKQNEFEDELQLWVRIEADVTRPRLSDENRSEEALATTESQE